MSNEVVAEYALRGLNQPVVDSSYLMVETLPQELPRSLAETMNVPHCPN